MLGPTVAKLTLYDTAVIVASLCDLMLKSEACNTDYAITIFILEKKHRYSKYEKCCLNSIMRSEFWYLGIIPYTLLIRVRFSFVVHIEEFLWGHVGNYLALSGGGSRLTSITDCHMYMFENLIYIVGSIF